MLKILRSASAALALLLPPLAAAAPLDPDRLAGLAARELGPAAVSGRITDIAAVAADPNRLLVGAATGGAWQSENGGLTWTPVFDDQAVHSVGAVAIFQPNPAIRWIGTGEGNVRNSTSIGAGIWKSIDGGRRWERVGLEKTERINRIAVHPTDPDIVYVAALGRLWGENPERGIYRTRDGGESWERVLYVDERTGGSEIRIDPHNPDKLYAALWQFRRYPDYFESGGPGSGLYLSWDGGESWQERTVEDGLPQGELGRIAIAPSPAEPGRVYALVEAEESALLRSDDGGEQWRKVNDAYDLAVRPFYYSEIHADPRDANRLYNVVSRLGVSIDGGKTFENNPVVDCCRPGNTIHIDNHALWINPDDPRHLVLGNDGGIAISRDRGETWRFVRNLPLAQFYHVAVDDADPYHVYGGLQDNGSWRGPAEIRQVGGIRNLHWQEVGFGDGFDTVPDPENPQAGYSMSQGGNLNRWNLGDGEIRAIRPNPPEPGDDLRFNWDSAFAIDPFDPAVIYYGSQHVHRSADRGLTWEVISPDLTSDDPENRRSRESGGLTPDVTAAENYQTIVAIAPSPVEAGVLWVGTDDGRVHVTRDSGESWQRLDEGAPDVTPGAWVPFIEASPHEAGTAFVIFDDHRRSDFAPYVFRVTGFGERWERLGEAALEGYALTVRQDTVDPELLFVGTEFGLFVSLDGGARFTRFTAGLPTVSVMDLAIQPREVDLVLGTHGRGVFVIDDYSGLRELAPDTLDQPLALLSVTEGVQYEPLSITSTRFTGSGEFRGENEPYGVLITFSASGDALPHPDAEKERARRIARREAARAQREDDGDPDEAADDGETQSDEPPKVTLVVTDGAGDELRRRRFPVHQGINRIAWDLSSDGARPMPSPDRDREADDGLPAGPQVPPGTYTVALELGEARVERTVQVVADPASPHGQDDREARYAVLRELTALRGRTVAMVERLLALRADVEALRTLVQRASDGEAGDDHGALVAQADAVAEGSEALEKRLRVPPRTPGIVYDEDRVISKVGRAAGIVASTFDRPSSAACRYVAEARTAVEEAEAALAAFEADEVASLREAARAAGIGLLAAASGG